MILTYLPASNGRITEQVGRGFKMCNKHEKDAFVGQEGDLDSSFESFLRARCTSLTSGQISANRFVLHMFRFTGTSTGKVLNADETFKSTKSLSPCNQTILRTEGQWLPVFSKSWFPEKVYL